MDQDSLSTTSSMDIDPQIHPVNGSSPFTTGYSNGFFHQVSAPGNGQPVCETLKHLSNGNNPVDGLKRIKISHNPPPCTNGRSAIQNSFEEECVNNHTPDVLVVDSHMSNGEKMAGCPPVMSVVSVPVRESWLLRLFESTLFDMNIAITYLFKSKEPGVLSYIGNRLFTFNNVDVDFYLFQLVTLYLHHYDIAEALHPYIISRCRSSSHFSLLIIWLLDSFCKDVSVPKFTSISKRKSLGSKLKNLILSEEIKPKEMIPITIVDLTNHQSFHKSHHGSAVTPAHKKSHHRSYSETTFARNNNPSSTTPSLLLNPKESLGDLSSGRAFDNGCVCSEIPRPVTNEHYSKAILYCPNVQQQQQSCSCGAAKLSPQLEFIKSLLNIGTNLQAVPSKDIKAQKLLADLSIINLNLPARVWLPIYSFNHMVIRIPPGAAVLLNSKERAPFLVYMEAIELSCDVHLAPIPTKIVSQSLRQTKSEENLLKYHQEDMNVTSDDLSQTPSKFTLNPAVDNDQECWMTSSDVIEVAEADLNYVKADGSQLLKIKERDKDTISQFSQDSVLTEPDGTNGGSKSGPVIFVAAGDIRRRLTESLNTPKSTFTRDPEDPSAASLKEPWDEKVKRIRESSPFGHLAGWRLLPAIIKCGDDLRQELMAFQFMVTLQNIWNEERIPLWIRPYQILVLSSESGMIEPILNTVSLHQVKKHSKMSLLQYFLQEFGPMSSELFLSAQRNFVQSCAAYCIVSYLIQVKDR